MQFSIRVQIGRGGGLAGTVVDGAVQAVGLEGQGRAQLVKVQGRSTAVAELGLAGEEARRARRELLFTIGWLQALSLKRLVATANSERISAPAGSDGKHKSRRSGRPRSTKVQSTASCVSYQFSKTDGAPSMR